MYLILPIIQKDETSAMLGNKFKENGNKNGSKYLFINFYQTVSPFWNREHVCVLCICRVLKVYDFYRQGSWTELVAEAKSVENDADTFLAFESSVAKILLLQLKHYALVQVSLCSSTSKSMF